MNIYARVFLLSMQYKDYKHREENYSCKSASLTYLNNCSNLKVYLNLSSGKELPKITEGIFAAIIAMIGTCIGSFGGIITSSKLTSFRIEKLEEKVDKHNNFAERMPVIEEQIKAIDHRIDSLENKIN